MKLIDWNYTEDHSVEYIFDNNGKECIKKVNRNDFSKHCEEVGEDRPKPPKDILEREFYNKKVEDEEFDFFNNYFDAQGNANYDLSPIEIIEGGTIDDY